MEIGAWHFQIITARVRRNTNTMRLHALRQHKAFKDEIRGALPLALDVFARCVMREQVLSRDINSGQFILYKLHPPMRAPFPNAGSSNEKARSVISLGLEKKHLSCARLERTTRFVIREKIVMCVHDLHTA